MQKSFLTFTLIQLLFLNISHAQFTGNGLEFMDMQKYSFQEIQQKSEAYFAQRDLNIQAAKNSTVAAEEIEEGRSIDNAYHKYKRWEWFWKDRLDPDGTFHDITDHFRVYHELQRKILERNTNVQSEDKNIAYAAPAGVPTWMNINQTNATGGYNGMGRATSVAFHPTDPAVYYVGAPIGGIWKTTNGGAGYTPIGDSLPYVSVGSIVVNPKKPSTIYISLGDHLNSSNYSRGVYKSLNGGISWKPTQLDWAFTNYRAIRKITMSPADTSILYAATSDGLYRTINGGAQWTRLRTGHHTDVVFKPNNNTNDGSIIYAGTEAGDIVRSTDGGTTWTQIYTSNGSGIRLSVTVADPNTIAASHYRPNTVVYSRNQGTAFTTCAGTMIQNPDMFILSQTNANVFYYGGVDLHKSSNMGSTWTQITRWCCPETGQVEVHADFHNAAASPINPYMIYFCNDGGVYSYNENTNVFTERTNGFVTTQFYRIATAQDNAIAMIGGTQDNGGRYRQPTGVWRASNGGDAMEQAVDPTNYQIMYSTYVNGELHRTNNAWGRYTEITPGLSTGTKEVGDWVTPYTLDPNNPQTIVAGYKDVWRSTDRGTNWTKISNNLTGGQNLNQIAVAPGASNIIYTARGASLWKTTNTGSTWTKLTIPNTESISSISINNKNNNTLWISRSGYNESGKVFKSIDGGTTWTNMSAGLPNVPVSCVLFEDNSNDAVYIGTDAGVFYSYGGAAWQYYGYGLPNTAVTDLAIQYSAKKLRVGTYGRGIWEIDLAAGGLSNQPPLVSITAPQDNSAFPLNSSVVLSASASDADGTVAKVEFYNQANLLTTITTPPYNYTFSNLNQGTYTITAKATDNSGATTVSSLVTFKIQSVASTQMMEEVLNSIYPNPGSSLIHIQTSMFLENATLTLLDALGSEVEAEVIISGSSATANVSHLTPGIYTLLIKQRELNIRKKIIVIK